jgi:hypothetical protein
MEGLELEGVGDRGFLDEHSDEGDGIEKGDHGDHEDEEDTGNEGLKEKRNDDVEGESGVGKLDGGDGNA